MISQNQIARLIEAADYRQLIGRILSNGRCRSLAARRALCEPETAAAAALGLALQRVCEITYRPTELGDSLARRLVDHQREDGCFGSAIMEADDLLAATAVAVRGLIACVAQHRMFGLIVPESIQCSIDAALSAIGREYRKMKAHGMNAVGWAIVLWQLGDVAEFRSRIDVSDLLETLDGSAADLIEDDLCRYAHAMAA